MGKWRDPKPSELETPSFKAVWEVIKTWDIHVPDHYDGYCGATGNHVVAILDGIAAEPAGPTTPAAVAEWREVYMQEIATLRGRIIELEAAAEPAKEVS